MSAGSDRAPHNDAWSRATSAREFQFPLDHGSHEDYRIEWWYYTGNLQGEHGERFGFQLTFFRTGLRMQPHNESQWSVRNLYTAHFAISDLGKGRHYQAQRNSRGAMDQAGARTGQLFVWNGDWQVKMDGERHLLTAKADEMELSLELSTTKPAVLHGEGGLSRKGPADGNASYYYSLTNLVTAGRIRLNGKSYSVTGKSWMDHEFSTSFLEPGQLGWDWFAMQFEDNTELMLYRMRREDGGSDPFSSGTFVDADGNLTHLAGTDFALTPTKEWKSGLSGGTYPIAWELSIPSLECHVYVTTLVPSQEMRTGDTTGITYWEGAIELQGKRQGQALQGGGYLEMTGYVGQGLGSIL